MVNRTATWQADPSMLRWLAWALILVVAVEGVIVSLVALAAGPDDQRRERPSARLGRSRSQRASGVRKWPLGGLRRRFPSGLHHALSAAGAAGLLPRPLPRRHVPGNC